jgi:hypothetical protein
MFASADLPRPLVYSRDKKIAVETRVCTHKDWIFVPAFFLFENCDTLYQLTV